MSSEFFLATVATVSTGGVSITIDGEEASTRKLYKRIESATLAAGDRVLVMKQSGTYIVIGKIV